MWINFNWYQGEQISPHNVTKCLTKMKLSILFRVMFLSIWVTHEAESKNEIPH